MYLWALGFVVILILISPSVFVTYSNFTTLYNASLVSIGSSMKPVFSKGDIIFSTPIRHRDQIEVGDYCIYQTDDIPEYICHQVIQKKHDSVVFQGVNETTNTETVPYEKIQSKVVTVYNTPIKIHSKYIFLPNNT